MLYALCLYILASFFSQCTAANRTVSPALFNSLSELARIVDIAYCVGTTAPGIQKPFNCLSHCSELEGFELITTWNTGPFTSDSTGYIAVAHNTPKRIIVAFRGTYSLANTILDLSAYPQPYVPYTPTPDDPDGDPPDGDNDRKECVNCTVHAGFLAAWHAARRTILYHVSSARARYPDYAVEVVGHSLGGAVAALAGTEMVLRGWRARVTTFGEPRVGNTAFALFLDHVFGLGADDGVEGKGGEGEDFRRVTHVGDPVPLLPPGEWGFAMHGGEVYISKEGLVPGAEDVVLCEGDADGRCIAGAESAFSRTEGASVGSAQVVLSDDAVLHRENDVQPDGLLDGLVPTKYRLWELLFAHRDYFLRLGLCVPGGDPTG